MAYSFSFNDVDFSAYGLVVVRGSRPFFPGVDRESSALGMGDGEVAGPSRYTGREIRLDTVVRGSSFADLRSKLDAVALRLNKKEDCKLILDDVPDRFWWARLTDAKEYSQKGASRAELDLRFSCGDSAAQALIESSQMATLSLDGQAVTCAVGGSADTWPVITVSVTSQTSAWGIANETLSRRLGWNAAPTALGAGSVLTLECDPQVRDLEGGQVVKIQRVGEAQGFTRMEGLEGYFPALRSGAGTLTFWGLRGTVTIRWRDRFLG